MKKIFLKFAAITILIANSFIACDNKHNKSGEPGEATHSMEGLNAQPQEEIAPASPIDSSASLKNKTNNPKVQGMNAQPQQEIAPSSAENK